MKIVKMLVALVLLLNCASNSGENRSEMKDYMLLDNFDTEKSAIGTSWEGFTDRVMGGVSEISVIKITESVTNYIRMKGKVSLKNNGGFIQIRLMLASNFSSFN